MTDDGTGALTDVQDIAVTVVLDSNDDGLSDAQSTAIGLDPQLTDTDGDGNSDAVEVGGDPANPIDTDADSVIDALEFGAADPNILDFIVPAPTATTLSLTALSGEQVILSGNGAAITANVSPNRDAARVIPKMVNMAPSVRPRSRRAKGSVWLSWPAP